MTLKQHQFSGCQWRNVIGSFFDILIALAFLSIFSGCHRKSTPEITNIGHVASFQGPDKINGEHARQGIQLALEEAEGADGTINDRRLEVIHVDCGSDPKAVEPATVRLVVINRVVALLGGMDGEQTSAMAGIAHNYEVPLITSTGTPEDKSNDYVFYNGLSPDLSARLLAEFATRHHSPPIRKIAILRGGKDRSLNSFLADKFAQSFLQTEGVSLAGDWTYKEIRKGSGAVEGNWEFKSSDDLKEIMEQLKSRKADAIFLAGPAADLSRLRKSDLDRTLPLFLAGAGGSVQTIASESASQPIFFVTAFALSEDERQKEFARRYESRFHEAPDAAAALAYDNTRILIEGIRQAASFKGPAIKQAIEDIRDFQMLTGMISFNKQDHWPNRPAFVMELRDGQSKVVHIFPTSHQKSESSP
jgi:branched-chain amino acid transport system substrate-binding protein